MSDNPVTPEALERLEKAANDADGWDYEWPRIEMLRLPPYYAQRVFLAEATPATILALLASFRTLESEKERYRVAFEHATDVEWAPKKEIRRLNLEYADRFIANNAEARSLGEKGR